MKWIASFMIPECVDDSEISGGEMIVVIFFHYSRNFLIFFIYGLGIGKLIESSKEFR